MRTRGSGRQWRRTHAARSGSSGRAVARRLSQPAEARRRRAEAAGHVEVVAGAAAAPRQHLPRARESGHRDVDHQRPRRPVMLPPASVTRASAASARKPSTSACTSSGAQSRRQREREQRQARRAAHRRDVGEVHRQRLPADVARRAEAAIEVDAFDEARRSSGSRARRAPASPPPRRRRCRRAATAARPGRERGSRR